MSAGIHLPPIAPGRLPLIGHGLPLIRNRLDFLQHLRTCGPIVRIVLGPKTVTVVNSPDLIQEMLTGKSSAFSKGRLFEELKLFGAHALPVAEGERHLERRRMMQPAFHKEQVKGYVRTMHAAAGPTISSWRNGDTLDLKAEMQLMAQDVVMSVAFSSTPDRVRAREILDSVDVVFRAALRRALLPWPLLERLQTRRNRQVAAASTVLRERVGEIITDHETNHDSLQDVVTMLLEARDPAGAHLPYDDILSEVTGLLAAGSETTAVAMAWLFHELGHSPDLEQQLHAEVDAVLGTDPPTAEHLPELTFTRRLVNESLRLYSPAWLVTRQAITPVHLGKYLLPAGTDVVWSPFTLHRDPVLYPDPLRFDPDRWLPSCPKPPRGAFIPFGAGKRQCMGDAFAWTEATLITALVASRWRLRPAPGSSARPVGAITVHPSALRMTAHPRHTASREIA
ncbi:cytochrome P450 [Streptomyces shenzhenensis]